MTLQRQLNILWQRILVGLVLCLTSTMSGAATDYYQFDTTSEQQRFAVMTAQMRCLVCQNETLAESNAALAHDLRQQIYHQITEGKTDLEIIDYLTSRYGNYILYKPPLNCTTWILWFAPLTMLLVGVGYLGFYIRKNRVHAHATTL